MTKIKRIVANPHLYFTKIEERTIVEYTSECTGQIDIQRFLDGVREFWITTSYDQKITQEKKVIVLRDPLWAERGIHGQLAELFNAGFEIYVSTFSSLIRVYQLNHLEYHLIIPSMDDDLIISLAAAQGIPKDRLHILNFFTIDELRGPWRPKRYQIDFEKLRNHPE